MCEKETLCWGCKNSLGGCVWAKRAKPVDGWEAEPTKILGDGYSYGSFLVKDCPEFIPDDRRVISMAENADIIGHCQPYVCRTIVKVKDKMKAKGYIVKYNYLDKIWYLIRR